MTSELGAEARALIEQASNEEVMPSPGELERIRRNVVAGAAGGALLVAAPHAGAAAVASVKPLALVVAALKGAAIGTAVAFGGFSLDRYVIHPVPARSIERTSAVTATVSRPRVDSPARSTSDAPPALPVEEVVPMREPGDAPRPSSSGAAVRAAAAKRSAADEALDVATAPASASHEVSAALHEETALLGRVQQELRAGRGAEALRLLDASSTRLERGQLRQERLAAEVLAACQTGDRERARRSIRAFLAENPATPSAARLRSSCVGAEFFAK